MTAPAIPRPVPGPPRPYRFPSFERTTLPNGLELIVAPVRRLPLVTIRFVLDVGARHEPRAQAGIATLAAAALAEGTTRLDAAALADEFAAAEPLPGNAFKVPLALNLGVAVLSQLAGIADSAEFDQLEQSDGGSGDPAGFGSADGDGSAGEPREGQAGS